MSMQLCDVDLSKIYIPYDPNNSASKEGLDKILISGFRLVERNVTHYRDTDIYVDPQQIGNKVQFNAGDLVCPYRQGDVPGIIQECIRFEYWSRWTQKKYYYCENCVYLIGTLVYYHVKWLSGRNLIDGYFSKCSLCSYNDLIDQYKQKLQTLLDNEILIKEILPLEKQ